MVKKQYSYGATRICDDCGVQITYTRNGWVHTPTRDNPASLFGMIGHVATPDDENVQMGPSETKEEE